MKHLMTLTLLLATAHVGQADEPVTFEIPDLIEGLANRDDGIRERSYHELLRQDVAARPNLTIAMSDPRPMVALRAGVILQHGSGAKQSAKEIALLLTEPQTEPWRWYLAAYVLGNIDPEVAQQQLDTYIAALAAPQPIKQYAAVQAIYRLGPKAKRAESALWALLDRGTPKFHGIYLDLDALILDDTISYTDAIGVYESPFIFLTDEQNVLNNLGDEEQDDPKVVFLQEDFLILDTLRRIGADMQRGEAPLEKLADVSDPLLRVEAARQLARLSQPAKAKAVAVLIELITDQRGWTRNRAILVLGQMGSAAHDLSKLNPETMGADDALAPLLSLDNQDTRHIAAKALKAIEPRSDSAKLALENYDQYDVLLQYEP